MRCVQSIVLRNWTENPRQIIDGKSHWQLFSSLLDDTLAMGVVQSAIATVENISKLPRVSDVL